MALAPAAAQSRGWKIVWALETRGLDTARNLAFSTLVFGELPRCDEPGGAAEFGEDVVVSLVGRGLRHLEQQLIVDRQDHPRAASGYRRQLAVHVETCVPQLPQACISISAAPAAHIPMFMHSASSVH
mgnify:CR=1 FL=1